MCPTVPMKYFCQIFGDSFIKCNFAWNSNLKSKIQNFEIYVSCIGLYKEKIPKSSEKGKIVIDPTNKPVKAF